MRYSVALLVLVCLFAAGCSSNGAHETDDVLWLISLGIDKAEDGDLLVTYRIANPQAETPSGGGDSEGQGKKKSTVMTMKAPSFAEARNILDASTSRTVSQAHTMVLMISEELARGGVQDTVGGLMRRRDFRGSVTIIVCRGKARDMFVSNNPPIDKLISRWIENYMRSSVDTSYYLSLNAHHFYNRLKASSGAPLAVGYGLNPLSGEDRSTGNRYTGRVDAYLPGDLPRQGGNPTEVAGTAVFKEDKLAGFLDTGETRALSILLDTFPHGVITITDPLDPKKLVVVTIRNGRKPKFNIDISGEHPVIGIDVLLEGEITLIPSGINYEAKEYHTLIEGEISNAFQEQITNMLFRTQQWGADVVDFGRYIRPKFWTLQDMRQYDWDKKYLQAAIHVKVQTQIRRAGLLRKSSPLRKSGDS